MPNQTEPAGSPGVTTPQASRQSASMRWASWVTAANVVVASGFAVAGLVKPDLVVPAGSMPNSASAIFALYAAARTLPLAVFSLGAIYRRAPRALLLLGSLAGVIQGLDALVGVVGHDVGKTIGPLVIAAFEFHAMRRLAVSLRPSR